MGTRGPSFFHRLLDISRRQISSVVPEFGVAGPASSVLGFPIFVDSRSCGGLAPSDPS